MFSNKIYEIGKKVNLIHHHHLKYGKESYAKIKRYILYILKYKITDDDEYVLYCHLHNIEEELNSYIVNVKVNTLLS